MEPVRFLIGERLYLRSVEREDIPQLQRWINHPANRRTLLVLRPYDALAEESWFASQDRSALPKNLIFAIVREVDDLLLGTTGVHCFDWVHRVAETNTLIGDPEQWGKGYASEAKALLLTYLFDTLNLHRVTSHTLDFNLASQRHLLKNGFVEEGRARQRFWREGAWHDDVLYGLLREDWQARSAG